MDEKMLMSVSGARLKACRELYGYTQEELAHRLEMLPDNTRSTRSAEHISYIENGKRKISVNYAKLLSAALFVRPEYLLLYDDYKTEEEEIEGRNEAMQALEFIIRFVAGCRHVRIDIDKDQNCDFLVKGEGTFSVPSEEYTKMAEQILQYTDYLLHCVIEKWGVHDG